MDAPLDLSPLVSRVPLDRPFARGAALAAGLDRRSLERALEQGLVRRLLRGVYVVATVPDDRGLRARALALVQGPGSVAVGRTAAWVHGVEVGDFDAAGRVPLEVVPGHRVPAADRLELEGARVTTPLRTALDLGRRAPAPLALAAMDRMLRTGDLGHVALLAGLAGAGSTPGVVQLRRLAVQVDDRAASAAESVLRLGWHEARLPTAVPGLPAATWTRLVRLALGVADRQFGAVLASQVARGEVTPEDLEDLHGRGWRVVVLPDGRVLRGEPELWRRHLEREFHQQLLDQVG